jgi:hypothetical protein
MRSEDLKLFTVSELMNLSEPDWLIENVFREGSFIGLYGPSGEGKTFLGLDWALSIAMGTPWCGHSVKKGPVVYVAAEGGRSIRKRVKAWMLERGIASVHRAFFLLQSVQVKDEEQLAMLAECIKKRAGTPGLVVFDTLARCFVGGDENSAKDMGAFIGGLTALHRELGASMLVLHHTGKQATEIERGSSALRAAADAMIYVSKDKNNTIIVRNNKQKDDDEFEDITLRLRTVVLGRDSEETSCVLESVNERGPSEVKCPTHLREMLDALSTFTNGSATTKEWRAAASAERTFFSHCRALVECGFVEKVSRGVYRLTAKGQTILGTAATAEQPLMFSGSRPPRPAAATATTP